MPKNAHDVIVAYTEDLRFYGIYATIAHAASHTMPELKESYARVIISQYTRYKREDANGFIFLRYNCNGQPIKTHDIRVETKPLAKRRLKISKLRKHLSSQALRKLSSDEIDLLYDRLVT